MSAESNQRKQNADDLEVVRPTTNSSWLAVIVLGIGVALAASYVVMDQSASDDQAVTAIGNTNTEPSVPPKPTR